MVIFKNPEIVSGTCSSLNFLNFYDPNGFRFKTVIFVLQATSESLVTNFGLRNNIDAFLTQFESSFSGQTQYGLVTFNADSGRTGREKNLQMLLCIS